MNNFIITTFSISLLITGCNAERAQPHLACFYGVEEIESFQASLVLLIGEYGYNYSYLNRDFFVISDSAEGPALPKDYFSYWVENDNGRVFAIISNNGLDDLEVSLGVFESKADEKERDFVGELMELFNGHSDLIVLNQNDALVPGLCRQSGF